MSLDEISDLKDRIAIQSERLARMEERQVQLYSMVERSLAFHGDVANRLGALEHLRTKVLAVAGLIGLACSMAWDVLKNRLSN
ncbi:MAG: hypothetical protein EBT07_10245 [Actinobacteria bacterium]|nr:hypothetical protein [Actinomycetota bacterium]